VKKARAKKAPTEVAPVKKAAARRPIAQAPVPPAPPAKKAAARKAAPAKNVGTGTRAAAKRAPAKKTGAVLAGGPAADQSRRRPLGGERSFAGDWEEPPPAPEPVREDPAARVRAVLRAAAASLEARDARPAAPVARRPPVVEPPPPPSPPVPVADEPSEPVTRVLIAPEPPTAELSTEDLEEEEAEEGDWAPPDVIDAEEPRTVVTAPPYVPPPSSPPSSPPSDAPAPPPSDSPAPPPWTPASPAEAGTGRRGGVLLPLVAIVLAVVVPLLGAIVGFVLANRARRRNAPLAGVARIVAVIAFVAWLLAGGFGGYARIRDEGVDYSKLKVGDCFDSSSSNEVRGVDVKPCSKAHNSEIFFLVTHPAGKRDAYPGRDALVQFAADACLGQPLTDYLGVPMEASKLKDFEIVPQESAWKDGRRLLVCGLDTGGQGQITGSVKGTRR
jgi:hypothetical protein